jgi:hypothetical protein
LSTANFSRYFTGYAPARPPARPLRVWGKNRGQEAAMFEVKDATLEQAIHMVKREGFERALVEVQ